MGFGNCFNADALFAEIYCGSYSKETEILIFHTKLSIKQVYNPKQSTYQEMCLENFARHHT